MTRIRRCMCFYLGKCTAYCRDLLDRDRQTVTWAILQAWQHFYAFQDDVHYFFQYKIIPGNRTTVLELGNGNRSVRFEDLPVVRSVLHGSARLVRIKSWTRLTVSWNSTGIPPGDDPSYSILVAIEYFSFQFSTCCPRKRGAKIPANNVK